MDAFKQEFKFFKRRVPPPDLSSVIDFTNAENNEIVTSLTSSSKIPLSGYGESIGLLPPEQWRIHGLRDRPGFFFVSNPFLPGGQRCWINRCLMEYPRDERNRTNLDSKSRSEGDRDVNGITYSKLRWVTLGYHHNWDSKIYDLTNPTDFPTEMQLLSKYITSVLGFENYCAEAAIINYYDLDSTIGGHTDHSELDHVSPLVSVSFGQTAVFLLGGRTKEEKPCAMYLKSGDIVVMARECRLNYHAVPRIILTESKPWVIDECSEIQDRNYQDHWKRYIDRFRINMNIRQVFPCKK